MEIKEALKKAKEIADGFMSEPVELEEVFLFYWDISEFDSDYPDAEIDIPIVVVPKDGGKPRIESYQTLSDSIKNQLKKLEQ